LKNNKTDEYPEAPYSQNYFTDVHYSVEEYYDRTCPLHAAASYIHVDIAYPQIHLANNEKVHAKLELALNNRMMNDSEDSFGDTKENLQMAIDGESYENTTMYPDFAQIAKDEGHKEASRLFSGIGKIEVEHENMFKMLLERLERGAEHISENEEEAWICEVCGHVHYGKKALKNCPVCKHGQEYQSRLNSKK